MPNITCTSKVLICFQQRLSFKASLAVFLSLIIILTYTNSSFAQQQQSGPVHMLPPTGCPTNGGAGVLGWIDDAHSALGCIPGIGLDGNTPPNLALGSSAGGLTINYTLPGNPSYPSRSANTPPPAYISPIMDSNSVATVNELRDMPANCAAGQIERVNGVFQCIPSYTCICYDYGDQPQTTLGTCTNSPSAPTMVPANTEANRCPVAETGTQYSNCTSDQTGTPCWQNFNSTFNACDGDSGQTASTRHESMWQCWSN